MSTETQGSSVLDKDPVKTRMRSENFDAGGYWPFHFYRETEGPVYGVEPIRTFTGVASFDIKLIDLQPNLQDIKKKFQQLANKWKRDTGHLSTVSRIVNHPSYLSIIAMGKPVIPLILKELKEEPKHWYSALSAISEEGPKISASERGHIKKISEAWLDWGRSRNYIE